MLGMASGVIVDAIMTAFFGLSAKTDSFFVASTVPLTMITIVALQAQKVIQPMFIHYRTVEGPEAGWQFLNNVVLLGTLITAVFCLLGIAFVGPITSLQMASPDAEAKTLTRHLAIWLFIAPVLMCPSTIFSSALVGLGEFVVPGLTKTIENLSKIIVAIALFSRMGILVLPAGLLLGVLLQNVQVYMALRRHGYRFRWTLHLAGLRPLDLLAQSSAPFAGHVLVMSFEVLQNTLATSLGSGALSALKLATRIVDALAGLVANSVVTATTPVVTEHLSTGAVDKMKLSLVHGLRLLLILALPAIIWLVVLGGPCVELLFQRKNFSAADTTLVAAILALMAPYIMLSRVFALAELPFYGARDTKTPLIAQVALAVFYSVLMIVFSHMFKVYGFPLARSVSYLGGCVVLAILVRRRYGNIGWWAIAQHGVRVFIAAAAFGLAAYGCHSALARIELSGMIWQACKLAVSGGIGFVVFCWSAILIGVLDWSEMRHAAGHLLQRLKLRPVASAG